MHNLNIIFIIFEKKTQHIILIENIGNCLFSSNHSGDFDHCGGRNQFYEDGVAVCDEGDTSASAAVLRESSRLHSTWLQHHRQQTQVSAKVYQTRNEL